MFFFHLCELLEILINVLINISTRVSAIFQSRIMHKHVWYKNDEIQLREITTDVYSKFYNYQLNTHFKYLL